MSKTVIGYLRVSTNEQARTGYGLGAQKARIKEEALRRGWKVQWISDDGFSAKDLHRPGITQALEMLKEGTAEALVVAKLDRVSRSVYDLAGLMKRSQEEGWGLVVLDLGLDSTTPAGRLTGHVMAAVAEWERDAIRTRTREALAQAKSGGVRLGRPVTLPKTVRSLVSSLHQEGLGLTSIAERLNDDGVPTARGGMRWYPSTVRAVLRSVALDEEARVRTQKFLEEKSHLADNRPAS